MPIYEFVCQKCGNEFEKIVSFSDTKIPACTSCNQPDVKRLMGKPAIHFKGSGWYITDSKKDSKKSNTSSDATKEKNSDTSDTSDSSDSTKEKSSDKSSTTESSAKSSESSGTSEKSSAKAESSSTKSESSSAKSNAD